MNMTLRRRVLRYIFLGILLGVVYIAARSNWINIEQNLQSATTLVSLLGSIVAVLAAIFQIIISITKLSPSDSPLGKKFTRLLGGREEAVDTENRKVALQRIRAIEITQRLEDDPQAGNWIPIKLSKRRSNGSEQDLPSGTQIVDVFDQAGGELLILGEPGAGKTIKLLQLAEQLIARAEADDSHPIPVVFDLASWAEARKSLAEWLVEELTEGVYRFPEKFSQALVDNDQLLLLLDGLDEVSSEHRADCARAINKYYASREEHIVQIVVCCRKDEYTSLEKEEHALNLTGAVILQPLTPQQIGDYLASAGLEYLATRRTLDQDYGLREFVQSPLNLSMIVRTFQETPPEKLPELASLEERRRYLFDTYIEQMFSHRGNEESWPENRVRRWLAWLARKMAQHGQATYLIERMQPDWSETIPQRRLSIFGPILIIGLIYGLIFWLFGKFVCGLFFGFIGLVIGLASTKGGQIETVKGLSWSRESIKRGLIFGLIVAIFSGTVGGLAFGQDYGLKIGFLAGLSLGLGIGLFVGLVSMLFSEVVEKPTEDTVVPNQGIRQSFINAMLMLLVGGLVFGLIGGLVAGLIGGLVYGWSVGPMLLAVAVIWPFIGLFIGLQHGGAAVIQHLNLRLILTRNGYLPWRLVSFLNYAVNLAILRRVGGGYKFFHPLLMEHFAAMEDGG